MNIVELKTKSEFGITDTVDRIVDHLAHNHCVAIACVLIHADGSAYIATKGRGNRLELLGAVTDLQYTICTDGDKP